MLVYNKSRTDFLFPHQNEREKELEKERRRKFDGRKKGEREANGGGPEQDGIHEEVGHRPQAPCRRYASSVFLRIRFLRPDLSYSAFIGFWCISQIPYSFFLMLLTEFRSLYYEKLSRNYDQLLCFPSNFGGKLFLRLFSPTTRCKFFSDYMRCLFWG